jgi:mannose-6-phosphate isomerase-like protein (cupin superfamily)
MTAQELRPYLNTQEENVVRFLGTPTIVRATGETTRGAFGLVEQLMVPPGFASPYHIHHREDESFYIIEGEAAFVFDGKWLKAGPGAFLFGPREIPHGFKIVGSAPARLLVLVSPAGFEHFVLEMSEPMTAPPGPPDMARLMAVAAKYTIDILGPLPE